MITLKKFWLAKEMIAQLDDAKEKYILIAADLSKQQALDTASKAIQPFSFTGKLA